jgi:(1->4)-alpha-D-glucan 1-alpha-D-glucosylmutase
VTGDTRRYEDIVSLSKLETAVTIFEPELRRLHQELELENLPLALASFHVYRTYIRPYDGEIDDADRDEIGRASVSEQLRRILFLQEEGHEDFVVRFQQTTGPVMAKGVEDTAFYRYFRLVALNEVGGDPGRFGLTAAEFHEANAKRAARFPLNLLTTYTHDTKRSPDVRARIVALTWLADEWAERVHAWRNELGGLDDAREELLVYQTLVGALPIGRERLDGYLEKALREGKVNTTWLSPDVEHERRVQDHAARVAALLEHDPFVARVHELGRRIALAQLLLKLTSPGVPDVYQGDELEDLSLVDPDNRRPVDWPARRSALTALRAGAAVTTENAKLFLTWKTLSLRAAHGAAFAGSYEPTDLGPGVCAYTRGGEVLVAVAMRPSVAPEPPAGWRDVLGLPGVALCVPA